MKKIISIFMLMTIILSVSSVDVYGQDKALVKKAKERAKELKKEKWYTEDSKTIEDALVYLYLKEAEGYRQIIGSDYGAPDENEASANAQNDAFQKVGQLGKSVIEGRIATNRSRNNSQYSRNAQEAFDRHVMRDLEGLMDAPYLTIFRDSPKGGVDCRVYYIVNSSLVNKSFEKAADSAISEMGNAKKYGEGVSDFINGNKPANE